MKKLLLVLLLIPSLASAAITFTNGKWESTFDCAEWINPNALNCDQMQIFGAWPTLMPEQHSQITTAANNPLGTGKGFRHWMGDKWVNGVAYNNNNSGPIGPLMPKSPEIWIRWYLRFQEGMNWGDYYGDGTGFNGFPYYHKLLYIFSAGSTQVIPGFVTTNNMALTAQNTPNYYQAATPDNSNDWQLINGGTTGDGLFHCYEIHLKMDTNGTDGIGEMWIDGQKIIGAYNVNWSNGDTTARLGWEDVYIGNNQSALNNNDQLVYEDYDDIVIYTSAPPGRDASGNPFIGPIDTPAVEPTCSDNLQNGDETGKDCGGSCPACYVPPPPTVGRGIKASGAFHAR